MLEKKVLINLYKDIYYCDNRFFYRINENLYIEKDKINDYLKGLKWQ